MSSYASADDALRKCLVIWEWLAKADASATKEDAYEALELAVDLYDCPACEYALTVLRAYAPDYGRKIQRCEFCPLYSGTKRVCTDTNEPYITWAFGKIGDETVQATHAMITLIKQRMEDLTKEQKE